jgi:hypothetical protein
MGVLFALACSIWALIKLLSLMSLCLCLVLCDARRNCVCIARYSTKLRIRLELVYIFLLMIVWHSARRTRTSADGDYSPLDARHGRVRLQCPRSGSWNSSDVVLALLSPKSRLYDRVHSH